MHVLACPQALIFMQVSVCTHLLPILETEACAKELPSWTFGHMQGTQACMAPQMGLPVTPSIAHTQLMALWPSLSRCHRAGDAEAPSPLPQALMEVQLVLHLWLKATHGRALLIPLPGCHDPWLSMTIHDCPPARRAQWCSSVPLPGVKWDGSYSRRAPQWSSWARTILPNGLIQAPSAGCVSQPEHSACGWYNKSPIRRKSNSLSVW